MDAAEKFQALQEAALAITSDLSLEGVLRKLVDAAHDLAQARYAALGVAAADRKGLARFIVAGVTAEQIAAVAHWPRGLGLLGALLHDPKPLRVRNIAEHPQSVGFPTGHPPMTSFLGVPVVSKGRILGNFYLTDKLGATEFSAQDEDLIVALAAFAAVTIENATMFTETDARLRRKVVQLERAELRSHFLIELSALLPTGPIAEELPFLREVLARATQLLGDACAVFLVTPGGAITKEEVVHDIPGRAKAAADFLRQLWPIVEDRVVKKGGALYVADIDARHRAKLAAAALAMRDHGFTAGMVLPVRTAKHVYGVFASLASQPLRLAEEDFVFGQLLASRMATAAENSALLASMTTALRERDESIATLRQAEQSLSQLAAIVEGSDDAIIGKTLEATITTWNTGAERLYGYSAAEAVGQPVEMIVPPERRDELARIMERLRCGERVEHFDTVRLRKDGSKVMVSVSISPIRDKYGRITGGSAIARDITERKRAEQLREEYVSLISHDLRNPLTVLTGQVDWLQRSLGRLGLARETASAAAALKGAQRMGAMIQELVESARLEAGRIELRKVPIDLRRLVADTIASAGRIEDKARVHLEAPLPTPVEVDPERTERAITNLLTNAFKYSPSDAPVIVRVGLRSGEAIICVADQGPGIPKEEQSHVFDRFYRASTAQKHEGLGLGLYITRLIAEAHAGNVSVDSEVGKGSTFCLTLPVCVRER